MEPLTSTARMTACSRSLPETADKRGVHPGRYFPVNEAGVVPRHVFPEVVKVQPPVRGSRTGIARRSFPWPDAWRAVQCGVRA